MVSDVEHFFHVPIGHLYVFVLGLLGFFQMVLLSSLGIRKQEGGEGREGYLVAAISKQGEWPLT